MIGSACIMLLTRGLTSTRRPMLEPNQSAAPLLLAACLMELVPRRPRHAPPGAMHRVDNKPHPQLAPAPELAKARRGGSSGDGRKSRRGDWWRSAAAGEGERDSSGARSAPPRGCRRHLRGVELLLRSRYLSFIFAYTACMALRAPQSTSSLPCRLVSAARGRASFSANNLLVALGTLVSYRYRHV